MRAGGFVVDAAWLAALHQRVLQPPLRARVPLFAGPAEIGSVEPALLRRLSPQAWADGRLQLAETVVAGMAGWQLQGDATEGLHRLALALRAAGLAHAWRDEQLAVHDAQGRRVATVERAVVRVLGITTQAVHLVGFDPQGQVWLQQRAWTKPNDPGLWDTLMGGMVSAVDDVETALARETWEEAGLRLPALQGLRRGGRVTLRRPAQDGGGTGYVIEHIDWFACTVPDGVVPQNQDGEVERFECVSPTETVARLERGAFTDEAALILVASLGG